MHTKILMVCLGNICRSPLAEGILRSKSSGKQVIVDSAGTAAYHIGETPDHRSVAIAKKYGIDISHQTGRQFEVSDFDDFDQIYVMDNSNYRNVINLARNAEDKKKVDLILNLVYPGENMDVPDPYYGGGQGFQHVFNLLDQACHVLINSIRNGQK